MRITLAIPQKKDLTVRNLESLDELGEAERNRAFWIDITEYDQENLKTIGEKFNIDPLTTEDIFVGKQRIKVEDYPDYLFAVTKGVKNRAGTEFEYDTDEIFMILTQNNIISLHKNPSNILKHATETIRNKVKSLKGESLFASLVLHTLYDFSVDSFYTTLSDVENWLDSMRSEVLDFDSLKASTLSDVKDIMSMISRARREMSELRMILTQHRDVVSLAERGAVKFVSIGISPSFRDIYDHTFQLIETVDSYMSRTGDVRDLYFTLRSAFTDNILRLLTIVATIFLPLSFLTGFYGMNFTVGYLQPGTSTSYGFYALITFMVILSATLLLFFRKRGWV